ncbi:hypothetical protein EIP91_004866 [Steccherinum ochraceum]|uniref:Hydrophobin n=1 Tax=Steccherinum ochraceum TaxID=92696 RepID=A0A4R0R8Q1_9APHY|nr:hypothetical protein EIP91_004866 [Steccherinum ochraceum]
MHFSLLPTLVFALALAVEVIATPAPEPQGSSCLLGNLASCKSGAAAPFCCQRGLACIGSVSFIFVVTVTRFAQAH